MDKPKSVEVSRLLAFEFHKKSTEHKGKPAERVMQDKVLKAISGHDDWKEATKEDPVMGFFYPVERPAIEDMEKAEAEKLFLEWATGNAEFLEENIFVELDVKCRAFLWKTFYVPRFNDEITPAEDAVLSVVAKVLGKTGALSDMREDVGEWEDDDEEEEEGE